MIAARKRERERRNICTQSDGSAFLRIIGFIAFVLGVCEKMVRLEPALLLYIFNFALDVQQQQLLKPIDS